LLVDPALPRFVGLSALDCYLSMGFVPGDGCILEGFNKLPPSHIMFFDLDGRRSRLTRYWAAPATVQEEWPTSDSNLAAELECLLTDAVRRQLVADVPVGVMLSGGVDSSLVTAAAVRATPQLHTFTVRFPGYGAADETEHARKISSYFGTRHEELSAGTQTVDLLYVLARQFDEPVIDSSMVPTFLLTRMIGGHCKVALGGDGGDELFGGYLHYPRLLRLQRLTRNIPRPFLRALSMFTDRFVPYGAKGRNWLRAAGEDLRRTVPQIACYFGPRMRDELMPALAGCAPRSEAVWAARTPTAGGLLERATRMDFDGFLPEDILVKVDRASMLNSLEVRAPFLDRSIIEFAFGRVPPAKKATPNARKLILRDVAKRMLPPDFNSVRKQGFSVPIDSWLRTPEWRGFVRDVLLAADASFARVAVEKLLVAQDRGYSNGERLFGLTMFELWRREYGVELHRECAQ
jgi:asparagine synthase (glutamine-hydrolysing)